MNSFTKQVSLNWQTLFIFIPGLNIWAAWRIQKLRRALVFFSPITLLVILFSRLMITFAEDIDSELFQYLLSLVSLGIFIICANIIIHYFRKWSRKWNEKAGKYISGFL